jgi:uncharacterized SAM-binding protein YcdF (DUF218 family)
MDSGKKLFYISETALILLSAFFMFALVGYRTIALTLLFIAAVLALFHIFGRIKPVKTGKILRIVLASILAAGLVYFTVVEIPIIKNARTDSDCEANYLLVLGAGVNGTEPSLSLLNRLTAAKDYLEEYPQAVAIVSGGQGPGEDVTEAECMRSWLVENGVSQERIICEDKATSTEENVKYALEIIAARGDDPNSKLAIVSSEYHLYRAKLIAAACGANACGVAGRTTYPVLRVNYFIREAFAVTYFWAFGV